MSRKVPWVRFVCLPVQTAEGRPAAITEYRCDRCSAKWSPEFPLTAIALLAGGDKFRQEHAACPEPPPEPEPDL